MCIEARPMNDTTPSQPLTDYELTKDIDAILDLLVKPSGYHDDLKCATQVSCLKHQQRNKLIGLFQTQATLLYKEATIKAVTHIMAAKTEGLFDGPDLFIKRAPIEQAAIDLIGFEAFKAIQDSLPSAQPQEGKKD
jgi:hypothetical protein